MHKEQDCSKILTLSLGILKSLFPALKWFHYNPHYERLKLLSFKFDNYKVSKPVGSASQSETRYFS